MRALPVDVAIAIREDGDALGLTARQLADRFHLSVSTVHRVQNGTLHGGAGGPVRPPRPRIRPGATVDEIRSHSKARLLELKVDGPEGCFLYPTADRQGYSRVKVAGSVKLVHRWAYELWVGPIPSGMEVDHTCHTASDCLDGNACLHRRCFRPDHLELVTHAENVRRGHRWHVPPNVAVAALTGAHTAAASLIVPAASLVLVTTDGT